MCCVFRSTYVGELNDAEASEVGEAVMGGILVDDEGDILHLLGAEPLHHGGVVLAGSVGARGRLGNADGV